LTRKSEGKWQRPDDPTRVVGFRLPRALAQSVKDEAAQRGIPLNRLFAELWDLYQKNKTRKS
jgi:hypothetical protein